MNAQNVQLFGVVLIPMIVGLVNVAKQAGLPNHLAPLLSVMLGILTGAAMQLSTSSPNWMAGVIVGVGLGLSATGLYSGTTTVTAAVASKTQSSAAEVLEPASGTTH